VNVNSDLAAHKGFLAYCLAMFDYAASETNQLSIAEYDVIGILDKAGDCHGWWRGYLHGRVSTGHLNAVGCHPPFTIVWVIHTHT